MKNITIVFFVLVVSHGLAQRPSIEWQKTYGSSTSDEAFSVIQTSDGGYLVSGYSLPVANADKTSFVGGLDYWVIRLDPDGNKLWDRTFGGSSDDFLSSAVNTSDGGFLLGGYSRSPVSGDKTAPSKGDHDYWIVKIDGTGNKVWDKVIGSPTTELLMSMASIGGGRVALGGYSYSVTGGDKSSVRGGYDYWVVVVDDTGELVWERTYGGTSDDILQSITATSDGGLIMAGYSISSASYEKTEASRASSYDYWVVKTDGNGNKQWDRTLGGSASDIASSIVQAPDGSYLVGGHSNSGPGYDKTTTPRGGLRWYRYCSDECGWFSNDCCGYTTVYYYNTDYWVVKLSATGSKMWEMMYGTAESDGFRNIAVTPDGFLLTGYSFSTFYDKSEPSRGGHDTWILKINAFGGTLWDKTIGGSFTDIPALHGTAGTNDGGFIVVSQSPSPVSGDKTEASKGADDYWIVKFAPAADTRPPVFESVPPAIVTASVRAGTCAAPVTWPAPSVSDNVGVVSLVSSHQPGATFPFGETNVTYTARDAAGNTATLTFKVKVVDNEKPVPTVSELPVLSGECGVEVTSIPLAIDNCSNQITGTTTAPMSYSAQNTNTVITWTYDDGNGNVFEQHQTVIVKDVTPPAIPQMADISQPVDKAACGARVTFFDPVPDDNCGVKSFARVDDVPYNSGDVFPEGVFEIIYEAIDVGDNVTVMSFQITVSNQVPAIASMNTSLDPVPVGTSIPVAVVFNDDNVVSSEISWGDGATSPGVLGEGTLNDTHIYGSPGVYTLGAKVIDACGLEAFTVYQYVVVYDPNGGFVTGGGWFHSPEGAYVSMPQASGKATFGFVSKYTPGTSVPTGNTDFQFQAGDLKFKSTSYEWLVVAGHKAMYKGIGIFNGSAGHGFLISAVDGAQTSTGDSDKFRIKIWDPSGAVVYDNQNGSAEDAEATTAIGAGSIVIHVIKSRASSSGRMQVAIDGAVEGEEKLHGAYPNPFKDVITVEFHSEIDADVKIDLLDVAGQSFYGKTYGFSSDGLYRVDLASTALSKKIYLLKITQGRRVEFLKVLRE